MLRRRNNRPALKNVKNSNNWNYWKNFKLLGCYTFNVVQTLLQGLIISYWAYWNIVGFCIR